MPPTADATTAVSQAMASRFTMPSGSYTDGQAKTVAWDSTWRTVAARQHLLDPQHVAAAGLQMGERVVELLGDLGRVRGAGQQHHLGVRIELLGRADQVDQSLLPGDPADEDHRRLVQVHAQFGDDVGAGVRRELRRCRCRS